MEGRFAFWVVLGVLEGPWRNRLLKFEGDHFAAAISAISPKFPLANAGTDNLKSPASQTEGRRNLAYGIRIRVSAV